MRVLKIQSKTLLNMEMVVKYLNFVYHIEVKTKSNYKILNFVFQFIKKMKWHFGYTDSPSIVSPNASHLLYRKRNAFIVVPFALSCALSGALRSLPLLSLLN